MAQYGQSTRPFDSPPCRNHPERSALWECTSCGGTFCGDCIKLRESRGQQYEICRECGGKCERLHGDAGQDAQVKSRRKDFWVRLPAAFVYPFKGNGLYIMIAGTVGFSLADLIRIIPIVGFIIGISVSGYLSAYIIKIIGSSSAGDDAPPDFPDFTSFYGSILQPLLLLLGTFAFCFGPAFVLYFLMDRVILSIIALVCGIFYCPMALTLVACNDSLSALNPLWVIGSVVKIPIQYMATVILFFLVLGVYAASTVFIRGAIPVIGGVINWFIYLYFILAAMNVLGTMYYCNEEKFA